MMEDFHLIISPTCFDTPKLQPMEMYASSFKRLLKMYNASEPRNMLHLDTDLLLPLLFVTFRGPNDTTSKVKSTSRTSIIATLEFFKSLGLFNEPIYSLVVDSKNGELSMSMCREEPTVESPVPELECVLTSFIQFVYSHVDDVIRQVQAFIMEHNVRTYDVTCREYERRVSIIGLHTSPRRTRREVDCQIPSGLFATFPGASARGSRYPGTVQAVGNATRQKEECRERENCHGAPTLMSSSSYVS